MFYWYHPLRFFFVRQSQVYSIRKKTLPSSLFEHGDRKRAVIIQISHVMLENTRTELDHQLDVVLPPMKNSHFTHVSRTQHTFLLHLLTLYLTVLFVLHQFTPLLFPLVVSSPHIVMLFTHRGRQNKVNKACHFIK